MSTFREYLENILIAVFLALMVRTFVLTGYKVPTSSMAPSLLPGDFIFSYRVPFGVQIPLSDYKFAVHPPHRGEVVVFTYPGQPHISYVKRVVGLSGDKIQVSNGDLVVNDQKFQLEPNETEPANEGFQVFTELAPEGSRSILLQKPRNLKQFGPIVVPPGEVFLLGDNRDSSDDSRYWGTVPLDHIEGRVVWIWMSLDWQHKVWDSRLPTLRWNRTWSSLK